MRIPGMIRLAVFRMTIGGIVCLDFDAVDRWEPDSHSRREAIPDGRNATIESFGGRIVREWRNWQTRWI